MKRILCALALLAPSTLFAQAGPHCALPGVTVLTDPAGDQAVTGSSKQDITSISVAELATDTNVLTFTLKVSDLSGSLPANGQWKVYFNSGATTYFVDMETDAASAATFNYGTRSGTLDSGVGAADGGSYSADGSIRIKLARSKFGSPAPGAKLTAIFGKTYLLVGATVGGNGGGSLQTVDNAPDTTPGTASYTIQGNASCGAPPPQSPCVLPGVTVVSDPLGDQSPTGSAAQDVESLSVAELAADTNTVTFTLKVSSLSGSLPANGQWKVYFNSGATTYFADMETDASSAVSFNYGTRSGTLDSGVGAADGGSYSPDGYIHVKLARAKFGNPPVGAKLTSMFATTYLLVGATVGGNGGGSLQTIDDAPDTTPGTASYTIQGNTACGTPPPQTPCALPGVTILTDAAGDQDIKGSAKQDILSLSVAEPGADTNAITFSLKLADLSGSLPPNGQWKVYFTFGATTYFVDLETDAQSAPTYNYGTRSGTLDSGVGAADAGSVSDGYIHIKIARSKIGNPAVGAKLTSVFSTTYLLVGATVGGNGGGSLQTIDSAPDTTPGTLSYTVLGNEACRVAPPTARLTADPIAGTAPLTVNFDGSASTDPNAGATITSYTFDFGDGSAPVTQATPLASYTYVNGGTMHATLVVADSKGLVSAQAEAIVDITGPPLARAGDDRTVDEGAQVTLDGGSSSDGNSGALSYVWKQSSGIAVALSGADTDKATFIAPAVCEPTDLGFLLKVSNAAGASEDSVIVSVHHVVTAPVANAGADLTVGRGTGGQLDGRGSTVDACYSPGYRWTQLAGGPPVALEGADTATPHFTAPQVDSDVTVTFELEVSDGHGGSATDTVRVRIDSAVQPLIGQAKVGALSPAGLLLLSGLAALARRRRR